MTAMISVQMKWYKIPMWKSIIISLSLIVLGIYASEFWFYIENGHGGGRSLFGTIFFAPLVFFPISKIFRIPYNETLDFCATAGSFTLGLTKLQCLSVGCCPGIILYIDENYHYVRFPSQIMEFITFLVISILLMYMSYKGKNRGKIFWIFLVIYGISRFIIEFFRATRSPYVWILSAGSFWAIISVLIGSVVLIIIKKEQLL